MNDFQSEQIDNERSGDRARYLKHSSTLSIQVHHTNWVFLEKNVFHIEEDGPQNCYKIL